MQIVIVADAGPDVGLGHIGRCTGIAQGLVAVTKSRPVFYLKDRVATAWIEKHGFRTISKLPDQVPLMIADSYRASLSTWSDYRRRAKRLLVIDDFGAVKTSPDWILNSSPFAHRYPYQKIPAHGLMLGPLFHPLRTEFWPAQSRTRIGKRVRNVLIVLGGGNHEGPLASLVECVGETLPEANVHVIVGPYTKLDAQSPRLIVHRSPPDMRAVIEQCDVAISAAGQTLFELAACGIPTLAIQIVENQEPNFTGFRDLGGMVAVGSIKTRNLASTLKSALQKVAGDAAFRKGLADAARRLVDGNGALRIAHAIGTL